MRRIIEVKNKQSDYLLTFMGLIMIGAGLFLVKKYLVPEGIMRALPYVCVGVGCGIFGHGMGNIISHRAMKNSPDIQRKLEIEKNDERNVAIGNRAKAKAYDIMVVVFGALMLSFALMGIDMIAVLLLVFAYLFVILYGVYYRVKYDREM